MTHPRGALNPEGSALSLLVTWLGAADHADRTIPPDHLALPAPLLLSLALFFTSLFRATEVAMIF